MRVTGQFKSRRGLTLIEMLVVLALTLFIMTLFTSLFVQATGGMNNARGVTRVDQNLRSALTVVRRDLKDVYLMGTTSPATAFESEDQRPAGGYFMIEENSPAIRQGLDAWGIPVEVDVDDVIAFTVQRSGVNDDEVFYGAVPAGSTVDRGDGLAVSRFAEVAYFLRPMRTQPTINDVRGPDGTPADPANWVPRTDAPGGVNATPMTYTLHRRQLVVLPTGAAESLTAANILIENFNYGDFEVSAKPNPENPGFMRFNDVESLKDRRNRFGLHHDPPPGVGQPHPGADYPYAWTTDSNNSSNAVSVFNLAGDATSQWFGRPISIETNLPSLANYFASMNNAIINDDADPDRNGVIGPGNDFTQANMLWETDATIPYKHGEDVMLENVVSFDIKAYDDDPRVEDAAIYPTLAANSLPTIAVNPLRPDTTVVDQRSPDFVDLGYRGDENGLWTTINGQYTTSGNEFSFDNPDNEPFGFRERWRFPGRSINGSSGAAVYSPLRTYDTWSDDYVIDPDDDRLSTGERLRPIPYPKPLKAVQIRIRVLDPSTGIVREATLVHRF